MHQQLFFQDEEELVSACPAHVQSEMVPGALLWASYIIIKKTKPPSVLWPLVKKSWKLAKNARHD